MIVTRAVGWTEAHNHTPGSVVHVYNYSIIIAVMDGYIAILESTLAPPNVAAQIME